MAHTMAQAMTEMAETINREWDRSFERVEARFERCWSIVGSVLPRLEHVAEAAPELGAEAEAEFAAPAVTSEMPAVYGVHIAMCGAWSPAKAR